MKQYDLIVVGGGVSGLMLASRAARGKLSVLLLEKEDRLGGCLQTWQVESDFWLEMGAHTAYNSYKNLLEVLAERNALGRLTERAKLGYRYLEDDRLHSPLARLNWLELLVHLPLAFVRKQEGASLAEYYAALFGRRNYARLLSPAFAAVLSQPADGFPAQWLFRRKPRMQGVPRKFGWPGGLQKLTETLAEDAPFEVQTGATVEAIQRRADGYDLSVGGETLQCSYLGMATPPDVGARLLVGGHPQLASRLSSIPMAEVESMAVAVAAERVRLPRLAGLIGVNDAFYSAVSRDPFPHARLRGFTFHFRPGRHTREEKLTRITKVLGVRREDIVAEKEVINRLPALEVEHVQVMEEVRGLIKGRRLFLAGNYFQGLSIGDCADRATHEAVRLIRQHKGAR